MEFEDFLTRKADEIDNAAFNLINAIARQNISWNMELIGGVVDLVENFLTEKSIKTCNPYYEGDEEIACVDGDDCDKKNCRFNKGFACVGKYNESLLAEDLISEGNICFKLPNKVSEHRRTVYSASAIKKAIENIGDLPVCNEAGAVIGFVDKSKRATIETLDETTVIHIPIVLWGSSLTMRGVESRLCGEKDLLITKMNFESIKIGGQNRDE